MLSGGMKLIIYFNMDTYKPDILEFQPHNEMAQSASELVGDLISEVWYNMHRMYTSNYSLPLQPRHYEVFVEGNETTVYAAPTDKISEANEYVV